MIAATGSVLTLAGCLGGNTSHDEWVVDETLDVGHAVQYNAPNCDCCDEYAAYLDDHLDVDLSVTEPDDIESVKRERGVPGALDSCHTVDIDEFVVEGHMPVAVITTALDQDLDVAGIALPGMPRGSPGMPGEKNREWTVYAFDRDGAYDRFRTL